MADLDDRGQILLIAGFALAVTFVALALVVNSAIFAENLATRSETVDATEALEQRHGAETAVGVAIQAANENNFTSYGDIQDNVSDSVSNQNTYIAKQNALLSGATTINYTVGDDTRGTRIVQDNRTNFTTSADPGNGSTDWTLATTVENTRAVEINVTDRTALDSSSPFRLVVDEFGAAPTWELELTESSGFVEVTVTRSDVGVSATCQSPTDTLADPVTIDVTGATIGGEYCHALDVDQASGTELGFGSGVGGPYNVSFENADNVVGNYSLVVDNASIDATTNDNYGERGTESQPHVFPAMYNATVSFAYQTVDVEYETTIEVAPGEPE